MKPKSRHARVGGHPVQKKCAALPRALLDPRCLSVAAQRRGDDDRKTFEKIPVIILLIFCLLYTSPALADKNILAIQNIKSPGGITAWLVEDHSVPVISLQFSFRDAGAKNDPPDKQGLTRLASNTMDEGAGDLKSQEFQKALQNHAITLYFNASRDHFGGELKTLTRHKDKAFDLLKLALTAPRFDEEPVGPHASFQSKPHQIIPVQSQMDGRAHTK